MIYNTRYDCPKYLYTNTSFGLFTSIAHRGHIQPIYNYSLPCLLLIRFRFRPRPSSSPTRLHASHLQEYPFVSCHQYFLSLPLASGHVSGKHVLRVVIYVLSPFCMLHIDEYVVMHACHWNASWGSPLNSNSG